jgi:uncharacterized RDD family membrane protein YckC
MTAIGVMIGASIGASDDAWQALIVLLVPFVAIPFALVIWIGQAIVAHRHAVAPRPDIPLAPAGVSDRLAALVIDAVIVGVGVGVPVQSMSNAHEEIAAVILGVVCATAYFAVLVAEFGRTVGQRLVGLAVVDASTREPISYPRAIVRSLVIVLEVIAAPTLFLAPPAVAELIAMQSTGGRSLTDRLLGTAVVTARAPVGTHASFEA